VARQALDRPASDEDRERAVRLLRGAGGELGLDELERRLDAAVQARTVGELASLVWDLPGVTADQTPPRKPRIWQVWRDAGFQVHATTYGLSNGFLVGIWALTGAGFFWPFFPAAGWGIGLGAHAAAVRAWQVHQYRARGRAVERSQGNEERRIAAEGAGSTAPPAPRDRVAVVFTDVVESTRLTEAIGNQEWSRLRSRHLALLRDCYSTHRGNEVNAQGDGCLAQFASPSDAVHCAVEIQRRLQAQREEAGFALTVRIGVHAGDAVVDANDLLGTAVNMAARVMSEAAPREILVTETIADELDARFDLEDRGLRTLKGFARPRHLLAVRWEGD
jgi:class 3 adenylate cyclase